MAIVFVPINGIGLGHLSRAFALAQGLAGLGRDAVILAQGAYPDHMSRQISGKSVGLIHSASISEREAIEEEVHRFARRSSPAVVIDDTHPAAVRLDSDVARLLIMRPANMKYMKDLRDGYPGVWREVLLADDPESPTWPFSKAQTLKLKLWFGWRCIGPVFRRGLPDGKERLAEKYRVKRDDELFIFTMGGGGVHTPEGHEVANFVEQAGNAGNWLRQRKSAARLIFVRGPLFPQTLRLPEIFEDCAREDDMPSLLGLARGAVIRPGFNTIWECLAAGTPFVPIPGETFEEPVEQRMGKLNDLGMLPNHLAQWTDPAWVSGFKSMAVKFAERWPASYAALQLNEAICRIEE